MCASTRFPEAIPLRNIKAKTIVKALTKFFTLVGFPSSIQSDQGSSFISGVVQQVMHELGITQYKSSAYHPQSQIASKVAPNAEDHDENLLLRNRRIGSREPICYCLLHERRSRSL